MKYFNCIYLIFIFSCNSDYNKNKSKSVTELVNLENNNIKKIVVITPSDSAFKEWVADTLRIIHASGKDLGVDKNQLSKHITIESDSLKLKITTSYEVIVENNTNVEASDVKNVLMVLNEYEELPRSKFEIKVTTNYYYSPSPIYPRVVNETIVDYEKIEIIQFNTRTVSNYTFVRGRIDSKTITRTSKIGNKSIEYVDFIWGENNKLVKQVRN